MANKKPGKTTTKDMDPGAQGAPSVSSANTLPLGAELTGKARGKRLKYNHVYTTGPFTLPSNTHSLDWGLLNNDTTQQTVRVTVFKCHIGAPKTAEPPGPLEVTVGPGVLTHNANAAQGGFFYEIQVETNSRLVFPYASAWPGSIGDPIAGTVVKSAEFIRELS